MSKNFWWKNSVVYEIYVRSFKDSNGDGIGDIQGIIEKLDYLKELGVDVLWLTPVYQSPNDDNGYDISDYCSIMETFGTMADFDELLKAAHEKKLRIVMDLVVNHTSDEHPWFVESRKGKDNPYRDYYIWKDGRDEQTPPNNWTSSFLGSAWQYDEESEQYYLHMFSRKQPDLNWRHEPVRKKVYEMMKWWLDKGIDGFRMDVISLISKDEDMLHTDSEIKGHTVCANGPFVHQYLQEMRDEVLSKYDIMTVGETAAVTVEEAKRYAADSQEELNMVFQFELMDVDGGESGKWNDRRYELFDVKKVLRKWQRGLYGYAWNSLFWNNHDQPRVVSRFGSTENRQVWNRSAKMLAAALYFLQGTPYIFQGEELGMTNVSFDRIEDFRDIESLNAYQEYVEKEKSISNTDMMRYLRKASRDNARTPMQWSSEENAGFTNGHPWIPVNENYTWINAAQQMEDEDSIFRFYQKLIRLRKESKAVMLGDYEEYQEDSNAVFIYRRFYESEEIYVFCNFTGQEQVIGEDMVPASAQIVLWNYEEHEKGILMPYETVVYRKLPYTEYDNDTFFDQYAQMSRSREGLKGAGEWHQLKPLFPPLQGKSVLDLGCGYGWHCRYAAEQGASKVLGIDLSKKMIEEAEKRNGDPKITYGVCGIEEYEYPENQWDCVVSNLALHYIEDLESVFQKIFRTLKPGGVFLLNMEHPVFTAGIGQDWLYGEDGEIKCWPVDEYFIPGRRHTSFLGCDVEKYHHTMTQILMGLINQGFCLEAVVEAEPPEEMMGIPGMKEELRRPMMLLVKAVVPEVNEI